MQPGSRTVRRMLIFCWENTARWTRGRWRSLSSSIIPVVARASRPRCGTKLSIPKLHRRRKWRNRSRALSDGSLEAVFPNRRAAAGPLLCSKARRNPARPDLLFCDWRRHNFLQSRVFAHPAEFLVFVDVCQVAISLLLRSLQALQAAFRIAALGIRLSQRVGILGALFRTGNLCRDSYP